DRGRSAGLAARAQRRPAGPRGPPVDHRGLRGPGAGPRPGRSPLCVHVGLRLAHVPAGDPGPRPLVAAARRPRSPAAAATLGPMLTLHSALRDKIVAHARADHPDEACGVIAGPAGQDRPERFIPMLNAQRSPTFYEFDSLGLLPVWREMDARDEEPSVIYHSHTATEAYPSRTDISYANEPGAHYVLVSTRDEVSTDFRSFRIVDGVVTEEPVEL